MSTTVPRHKGTGLVPIITALNAHPRGRQEVPAALKHYLDNYVVATEWYPEEDWSALLHSLASALEPDGIPDIWGYFGRVAAYRDLKGTQHGIPMERRVDVAGVYRRFATEERADVATALVRYTKLWSLYHDTGELQVGRRPSEECGAILRLLNFPIGDSSLLTLFTAYFSEYLVIVGNPSDVRVVRATCYGHPLNEWECGFDQTPENIGALAYLPLLR